MGISKLSTAICTYKRASSPADLSFSLLVTKASRHRWSASTAPTNYETACV